MLEDIHTNTRHLLQLIVQHPGQSLEQISAETRIFPWNASAMAADLVDLGLVHNRSSEKFDATEAGIAAWYANEDRQRELPDDSTNH